MPAVQQLRDKLAQMMSSVGQQTQQQKIDYLSAHFTRWSMGQQRMTHQQFIGALQSLHLPLTGASEVFPFMDKDGNGTIDIREFCDAMVGSAQPQPRLAVRNAGSAVVSGLPPTPSMPTGGVSGVPGGDRGYTPTSQKMGGSRVGSRAGSATRSPIPPATPQALGNSLRPPAGPGPRRPSRAPSVTSAISGSGGAELEVDLSEVLVDKFRRIVLNRGGVNGIHSLSRIFRMMDDDGNRKISLQELQTGLNDYGLRMELKDLQLLLAAVDKDNTGSLSFDELLSTIRGPVSARRQALINMAFDILDRTGNGVVQVDDIAASFSAQSNPDVVAGRLTQDRALDTFLAQFDGPNQDGTVTRQEFLEYYRNVSASIDDDDYFELMIRNAWHISGGVGQYENTSNTRIMVTLVDGTQKVVHLEHDLGLDLRNGPAVRAQLKAQGITNVLNYSASGRV